MKKWLTLGLLICLFVVAVLVIKAEDRVSIVDSQVSSPQPASETISSPQDGDSFLLAGPDDGSGGGNSNGNNFCPGSCG